MSDAKRHNADISSSTYVAGWVVCYTDGPHLFHFKSLGLLAVSLDNGNAGIVRCQLSKWIEQDVL